MRFVREPSGEYKEHPVPILRTLLVLIALACSMPALASEAAWQALREGGTVALLRHARAPGTGDPAGFRLGECATQRNLSAEGREQSRRIGAAFETQGVAVERVLSSRWCRALDTARLAFGDRTEPFPPLDSFFSDRTEGAGQTQAVRAAVASWRGPGVLALVTHQVNITALTGVFPAEGEVIVLRPGGGSFEIVGTIKP
jgi:phosphohistidine phosphatase SixA